MADLVTTAPDERKYECILIKKLASQLFYELSNEWFEVFYGEMSHEHTVNFYTSDLAIYSPEGAFGHAMELDEDRSDLTCIQ